MHKKTLIAAALAAFIASIIPASAQTSGDTTAKKPSAAQAATRERMTKCAAEWKEAKAAGKVEKGTTWPKYWSACNKRLKGASDA